MSLFKEKDDLIKSAFQHLEQDSDEDEEEEACEENSLSDSVSTESPTKIAEPSHVSHRHADINKGEINSSQDDPAEEDLEVFCIEDGSSENDCIYLDGTGYTNAPAPTSTLRRQIPPADQIIDLSSDDDIVEETPTKSNQILTQNTSLEDRKYILKLTIAGCYKQYNTTYRASLANALESLLDDLAQKDRKLKLFHNDKEVSLSMSPMVLDLRPGTILRAIDVPLTGDPVESEREEEINMDSDFTDALTIKLQDGNRKHTKDFKILPNEPLSKLKIDYAREFNLNSASSIKLFFDGDEIEDESTAEDVELEDGYAIDVVIA